MTTTSLNQQWERGGVTGGGDGGGEKRRRWRREGENRPGGGLGPPDLDLDLVETEAREEKRRRDEEVEEEARKREEEAEEERRRRKEEKEARRHSRSQTVTQKKHDDQRERGRRSRSLPRHGAQSRDALLTGDRVERPGRGVVQRRVREEDGEQAQKERSRGGSLSQNTEHSGSSGVAQRAAFSFLRPMDSDECQRQFDSDSVASFSEVSLSAASIATAGWRGDSSWSGGDLSWQQGNTPGPWLEPSTEKLTALLSRRLNVRELVNGLSL